MNQYQINRYVNILSIAHQMGLVEDDPNIGNGQTTIGSCPKCKRGKLIPILLDNKFCCYKCKFDGPVTHYVYYMKKGLDYFAVDRFITSLISADDGREGDTLEDIAVVPTEENGVITVSGSIVEAVIIALQKRGLV